MNIRIDSLYMKDFKCVREAKIDFPNNKIIYIQGDNAMGKSTIIEALAICFGDFRKGDSYKDFVNWDEDSSKKAEVIFKGAINNEDIEIKISITDGNNSVTSRYCNYKGTEYNGSEVLALLSSLEVDYFSNVIFFLQSSDDITKMSPSELSNSLQKLLNFDLDKYTKKLEEHSVPLKEALIENKAKLDVAKNCIFADPKPFINLSMTKEQFEEKLKNKSQKQEKLIEIITNSKKIEEIKNKQTSVAHQIEINQYDLKTLKESIEASQNTIKKFENDKILYANNTNDIKTINEKISSKEDESKKNENFIEKTKDNIRKIEQLKDNFKKLTDEVNDENNIIAKSEGETKTLKDTLTNVEEEKSKLDKEIENYNQDKVVYKETLRIIGLIKEGKCPCCGRPTKEVAHDLNFDDKLNLLKLNEDELKTYCKNFENKNTELNEKEIDLLNQKEEVSTNLTKVNESINYHKNSLDGLVEELNNCKHELETYKDSDIESVKQTLKNVETQNELVKNEIDKLKEEKATCTSVISGIVLAYSKELNEENIKSISDSLKENYDSLQKQLDIKIKLDADLRTQQIEVNKAVETLGNDNLSDKMLTLENEVKVLTDEINKYNRDNDYNKQIEEFNKKIEEDKKANEINITKLEGLIKDISDELEAYEEAFSLVNKNLPNYLTLKMCAKLEKIMNDFLQVVFPSMSVSLQQNKKGVSFFYTNSAHKTRKTVTAKMASGMEKALLSISWRVALARAYSLNILFLDEIDSASSDKNSFKIFSELFEDVSFNQFIIISHKAEVIAELKQNFDNIVIYEAYKGNFEMIM